MKTEIEKRFLLLRTPDLGDVAPVPILQGYIATDPARTVRIRRIGDEARITLKGLRIEGIAPEYEYPIPVADADDMLKLFCHDNAVTKNRYAVPAEEGLTWEVDFFTGRHQGLMIAEIELPAANTLFERPDWMYGHDITTDNRFANAVLARMNAAETKALIDEYRHRLPPVPALRPRYS